MKHLLAFLCATAVATVLAAAPLDQPGVPLDAAPDATSWHALFAQLAPRGPVFSHFTETRHFLFRQHATVLHGEMRLDPARGLSLHYTDPEVRTVVVDHAGLLLRDAAGQSRSIPAASQPAAANEALLPVLQFNEAEILRRFIVRVARSGDDWRIDFAPRDPALRRALGQLVAWGNETTLRRIEIRRSETQRIDIAIDSAQRDVHFSAQEEARYFR